VTPPEAAPLTVILRGFTIERREAGRVAIRRIRAPRSFVAAVASAGSELGLEHADAAVARRA
jgi:hypothetical protein